MLKCLLSNLLTVYMIAIPWHGIAQFLLMPGRRPRGPERMSLAGGALAFSFARQPARPCRPRAGLLHCHYSDAEEGA